jgi:hypothetical protein
MQYFGQNLGCLFDNDAVVTQGCVIRAGFVQTVPVGSMLTHSSDQVWVEGPTLATGHGKSWGAMTALMTCFQLGAGSCAQAGLAGKLEFGF